MMRIKNYKLATVIYKRAKKTLESKKFSDATAAISLYRRFYEEQDFGNGNSLTLPYIKDFNEDHDCNTNQDSQYKTINDSGLSKVTEIYDALKQVIEKVRTLKIIAIGFIFLIISITTSVSQYRSYNAYYKERNKNYNEIIENLSIAESILKTAESITATDSNSAYRAAGCITTYNAYVSKLHLNPVADFIDDINHKNTSTGKMAGETIASFENLKIQLYGYVAKENRLLKPITIGKILGLTIWENIITSIFQIISTLGSLCTIIDFFRRLFKREEE